MKSAVATAENVSAREIVKLILPKEHGSWSLALEPVALGLLVAPSLSGGALAIAAVAGFFLRRPLKIFFREENEERLKISRAAIFILAITAITGLSLAAEIGGIEKLWPLIPAAIAGLAFAFFDSRNEGREGAAEISGAIAFGVLPAASATLAGWNFLTTISLSAVMLARSVPTVLFVRTYLRIKKGKAAAIFPAILAATAGFFLIASLAILKIVPWLSAIFAFALAARAIFILTAQPKLSAKIIGITEAILGGIMIPAIAIAWRFF